MTHASALPRLGAFHHVAFRCRDAGETRRFYEGLLGRLPLAAGLAFDEISGTDTALRYMHVFFQLGDGNYLAFFDAPDSAKDAFKPRSGFNRHIAIAAPEPGGAAAVQAAPGAHGVACNGPLDHGFDALDLLLRPQRHPGRDHRQDRAPRRHPGRGKGARLRPTWRNGRSRPRRPKRARGLRLPA